MPPMKLSIFSILSSFIFILVVSSIFYAGLLFSSMYDNYLLVVSLNILIQLFPILGFPQLVHWHRRFFQKLQPDLKTSQILQRLLRGLLISSGLSIIFLLLLGTISRYDEAVWLLLPCFMVVSALNMLTIGIFYQKALVLQETQNLNRSQEGVQAITQDEGGPIEEERPDIVGQPITQDEGAAAKKGKILIIIQILGNAVASFGLFFFLAHTIQSFLYSANSTWPVIFAYLLTYLLPLPCFILLALANLFWEISSLSMVRLNQGISTMLVPLTIFLGIQLFQLTNYNGDSDLKITLILMCGDTLSHGLYCLFWGSLYRQYLLLKEKKHHHQLPSEDSQA